MAMAAQTQRKREAQFELDSSHGCCHERVLALSYARERRRIQALCQWMAADAAAARQLSVQVFVEAWSHPQPDARGPGGERDRLTAAFAAHFKPLFRAGQRPAQKWYGDSAGAGSDAATARAAVRALPAAERLVYLLHDAEGYDGAVLAAWLGMEPHRCAQCIHQARQHLCRSLRLAA